MCGITQYLFHGTYRFLVCFGPRLGKAMGRGATGAAMRSRNVPGSDRAFTQESICHKGMIDSSCDWLVKINAILLW